MITFLESITLLEHARQSAMHCDLPELNKEQVLMQKLKQDPPDKFRFNLLYFMLNPP